VEREGQGGGGSQNYERNERFHGGKVSELKGLAKGICMPQAGTMRLTGNLATDEQPKPGLPINTDFKSNAEVQRTRRGATC
jgi:hypothetical protein